MEGEVHHEGFEVSAVEVGFAGAELFQDELDLRFHAAVFEHRAQVLWS